MVINSKDYAYEVIQTLSEETAAHYLCRRQGDAQESSFHLVKLEQTQLGAEGISCILDIKDNIAFTDLKEYFLRKECIFLVFPYPSGVPLNQMLKQGGYSGAERFSLGQKILERFILMLLPAFLQWELLKEDAIYVTLAGDVEFYYPMEAVSVYRDVTSAEVWKSCAACFLVLFCEEETSGLYPEISRFLGELQGDTWPDVMEVYQAYLLLLPLFLEERKAEEKVPLRVRLKAFGTKALTGVKIVMGIGVLLSACALLPELWKEKVEPVVEAAVLWKAVYVDGETLVQEEESIEEPPTEPVDMDNGMVTRRWDNGNILYKGEMIDGLYDGKGTLYYPDAMIHYQGSFAFGKKEGEGSLYGENGILKYEGGFHKDQYEGEGKLNDSETGILLYEGGFVGGKYQGKGVLFNVMTDFPVYDGEFRMGFYDGEGAEYDSDGGLLYEGKFLLGVYHGFGIYYDGATGTVLLEGEFRNGMLVTPKEEAEPETEPETESEVEPEIEPETEPETEASVDKGIAVKETKKEKGPGIVEEGEKEDDGNQDSMVVSQER